MRYPLLSFLSFLLHTIGLVIFMSVGVIGFVAWQSFGLADWQAVQTDPMRLLHEAAYRDFILAAIACILAGSLFMGLGELLKVFFNIEKHCAETTRLLLRLNRIGGTGNRTAE